MYSAKIFMFTKVYSRGVKFVSVQGPLQTCLISTGPGQCNHRITPWL